MYEEWDDTDPYFKVFIGKFLEPLIEFHGRPNSVMDDMVYIGDRDGEELSLNELREFYLTFRYPREAVATMKPLTAYPQIHQPSLEYCPENDEVEEIPYLVMVLWLQIWMTNSEMRMSGTMILDTENWDNTPEALDSKVAIQQQSKVVEELPWV